MYFSMLRAPNIQSYGSFHRFDDLNNILVVENMISPHAHWLMFGASSPDESILELVDDGSVDLIAEVLHSALSIGRLKNDRLFIVGELALGLCIDSNQLEILPHLLKETVIVPLVMRGDGNTMGDLGDDLQLIRIYTKPKGQLPDYEQPVILQSANGKCTVEDFCNKIHRTIINELKYALVWGTSAKHQPMRVGRDHVLHDEDVVQIVKSVK